MLFYIYILYSSSLKKFYTGHSDNVKARLNRHNSGRVMSTKKGIPWRIVIQFESSTKSEAASLELKIKKRGAKRYLEDLAFPLKDIFGV